MISNLRCYDHRSPVEIRTGLPLGSGWRAAFVIRSCSLQFSANATGGSSYKLPYRVTRRGVDSRSLILVRTYCVHSGSAGGILEFESKKFLTGPRASCKVTNDRRHTYLCVNLHLSQPVS